MRDSWPSLRAWARRRRAARQARVVVARQGVYAACCAMRTLNQVAKHGATGAQQLEIYVLKRRLIGELLEAGYACRVSSAVHRRTCWSCGGSGEWRRYGSSSGDLLDVDTCYRCGGTGVYAEHALLLFVCTIAGERFGWHQPAAFWPQFRWDRAASQPYEPARGGSSSCDPATYELHTEVVAQWIAQQGLGSPEEIRGRAPSLWGALRWDLRTLHFGLVHRWRIRWRPRLVEAGRHLVRRPRLEGDDDLPF